MVTAAKARRAACGIRVAASSRPSTHEAIAAAALELHGDAYQHIIIFFSSEHDLSVLTAALANAFPDVPVSGCSTAGEVGPLGMMQGGIVLIAFPETGFRVLSEAIPAFDQSGVERASEIARRLKTQIILGSSRSARDNVFALVLIDGLSNKEEALIAAVIWSLDDIELIGGSAGDGLAF